MTEKIIRLAFYYFVVNQYELMKFYNDGRL